jgi:branched-chain amino acid aminotransferase
MRVWLNGSILDDPTAPVLRLDDHGFTVGDGVFETLLVRDGAPFALTRHLARLVSGAARLGLPEPDLDVVRRGIDAVTRAETPDLGRLRITYTAGPAPMGSGRGGGTPTLAIAVSEIVPQPASAAVVRSPWARNERSSIAGVKTVSFADNVVALAWARKRGASEALFANTRGELCEGTGSNVGYVVDGEARTPTLRSGCLPGVTRALALEWCGMSEIDDSIDVLDKAEEVFLLSTTREIQPVHRLDTRGLLAPGPVTMALMATWAARAVAGIDP